MQFEDILYEKSDGIATITINRPEKRNAFRTLTVDELIVAFQDAWWDHSIGVVIFTGVGDKAFCAGGDQSERGSSGYDTSSAGHEMNVEGLHNIIRNIPKPVIAAVNGFAIGGGHVLHVLCDISLAADTARFGQTGPRVGSFDAGYGSAYLARIVGEKKAREIWYFCRQYTAEEAREMGLVNKVVPADKLMEEARAWANELLQKSPTALKFLKYSFNADTAHIGGISNMAMSALELYYQTDEALEGVNAFNQRRPVDFSKFRK
ncbi:MAG: 1,4-dihydroxy-2-naphthoyl-CoA synthase [Deltaproteobacteria bacterium]|nr:1,4-dihydroxy-2-naphthoyl-CoA synthase [Deltaproteobacteria bacterium]